MDTLESNFQKLDPSKTLQGISTTASSTESPTSNARCPMQQATKAAQILLGCYRKGDAADPDTYAAAVAATLALFPTRVVLEVASPTKGLPSRLKFLPAVAEVRDACEAILMRESMAADHVIRFEQQQQTATAEQAAFRRKQIAMCHCWIRAQMVGDPKAEIRLREFSPDIKALAREMSITEVVQILPEVLRILTKPVHQISPLPAQEAAE